MTVLFQNSPQTNIFRESNKSKSSLKTELRVGTQMSKDIMIEAIDTKEREVRLTKVGLARSRAVRTKLVLIVPTWPNKKIKTNYRTKELTSEVTQKTKFQMT